MLNEDFILDEYIYFCYSLKQYHFFKNNGLKSLKRLKSCNEDKFVWLFENNNKLKELRNIWRQTYPYMRGDN